jgi:hypothetical protein
MAFETKNKAKKFGSKFAAKKYDEHHPAGENLMKSAKEAPEQKETPEHEAAETPQFEAGEQEGAQEQQQQQPQEQPSQVVAKHGKALHVHTSHDNQNNKHHVHSVHADGHVHDSDHASQQEAQETAKQLGGGDQQAPMMAEEQQGPEPDGFQMPRLA